MRYRFGLKCPRCSRPARELGGLCTAHWMGLSASERAVLVWDAECGTEPIDALEVWFRLPSGGGS